MTEEATEYQESLIQAEKEKKEKEELSTWGLPGKKFNIELKERIEIGRPQSESLLQINSASNDIDPDLVAA